jgi:cysteine desulfurase
VDIYLDYNATTPVDPAVLDAMLPHLGADFGNAASTHPRGRRAAGLIESARRTVGDGLGVDARRVVWTSGSTEALNTALKCLAGSRGSRHRLVVSATEHKAVLDVADWLAETESLDVVQVPPRSDGVIDLEALADAVTPETFAVSVMAANNETGVINPIDKVAEISQQAGATYVCDATQVPGKGAVDLGAPDILAVSAHKVYGPQGVGALVVPRPGGLARLSPLLHGGGHERGLRSGTLNLPGIVGFATAIRVVQEHPADAARLGRLRDRLEAGLRTRISGVTVHGQDVPRLPNTTNLRIDGVDADALIVNTPEVAFSSGSACTAAVPTPSHVLTAMGLSMAAAEQSIRLSVGRFTTEAEVDRAIELLAASAERLRALNGAA